MNTKPQSGGLKLLWQAFVLVSSIGVVLLTWRVFILGVEVAMPQMAHQIEVAAFSFYTHFVFAPLALLVMPFQFWGLIRRRWLWLHRWLGRAYLVAVFVGGLGGFMMALSTDSGVVAGIGFASLAVCWIGFTALAYLAILQKRINDHRQWMLRSATLTFAAVTLRAWLPLSGYLQGAGLLRGDIGYTFIAWHWIFFLIFIEFWIQRNWAKQKKAA